MDGWDEATKSLLLFYHATVERMSSDAQKRIQAIEQYAELGSGSNRNERFEIRGAGDILGGEQSGFINDIGFDTTKDLERSD